MSEDIRILAIDPATICGWATKHGYGTWNLKVKRDESVGMKWIRFRSKMMEVCELENISIIVYERPSGRHTGAVIHHSKLIAMIEAYCADAGLEFKGYSSTEIKKHATGKGNCNKQDMIDAAISNLGYDGSDDNEADALWLYELAIEDLGL